MKFKLIVAMTDDERTSAILEAARKAGATGSTVITSARGEGLTPPKTFLGLGLEGQRDVVLLIVEGHMASKILEAVAAAGKFEAEPGSGIVFQLDIEDTIGLRSQVETIERRIGDEL